MFSGFKSRALKNTFFFLNLTILHNVSTFVLCKSLNCQITKEKVKPSGAVFTITLIHLRITEGKATQLNDARTVLCLFVAAVCFRHYCLIILSETRMCLVDSRCDFNSQGPFGRIQTYKWCVLSLSHASPTSV